MQRFRFGRNLGTAALAGLLFFTACDDSTAPADPALDDAALATFLADFDPAAMWAMGMSMAPHSAAMDFSRSGTFSCPGGGTITMTGTGTSSLDEATRVLSTTWSTTQTHANCAFTHPTRTGTTTTTVVNGTMTASGAASYLVPETRGTGRKLLTFSSKRVGSTTSTTGASSVTCAVDITETFDPAANSFTIKGVMCGREVNVTRTMGQSGRSR